MDFTSVVAARWKMAGFGRLTAGITTLAMLAVQYGCAAPSRQLLPPAPLLVKLRTQRVALVSLPVKIDITSDLYAKGLLAGGFKGAATGPIKFMTNVPFGSCQGAICGAGLLIWAGLAVTIGPMLGAVEGVLKATPEEEAKKLEQELSKAVDLVTTHLDLTHQVLDAANRIPGLQLDRVKLIEPAAKVPPDYRALQYSEYGTILEVAVRDIHFQADTENGSLLGLYLKASARIINPETQHVVYENEFTRITPSADWRKKSGSAILKALDENIQSLAQSIVNNVFESVSLPLSSNYWAFPGTQKFGWCWLEPINPPIDYRLWGAQHRFPTVNSRQPTLTFRAFPDDEQAEEIFKALGTRINTVTYDIRVLQPSEDHEPKIIYEKQGIKNPSHTIEQPLEHATEYYWSMRACFPYKQITVCTPWAFSSIPATGNDVCYSTTIPQGNYFRFQTPSNQLR